MNKQPKWILIVAAGLFLAGCGTGSNPSSPVAGDQAEEVQEDSVEAPSPEQPAAPQSSLLCENPPPTELGLGGMFEGTIDDPVWIQCFWVEIPEGLSSVTFELSDMSADLNISVGYGFLVTLLYNMGEFWRVAQSGTTDELLILENPEPGPYFIKVGIAGPKEPSPFTVAVRTEPETVSLPTGAALPESGECAFPALEVGLNTSIESEIIPKDQDPLPHRYFCAQVPDGLSNVVINLTGLESDLDLFVRHSRPAEWLDRSRGEGERIVIIENPESGAYYIDVVGAYAGAGSSFTLSVSTP